MFLEFNGFNKGNLEHWDFTIKHGAATYLSYLSWLIL